MRTLQRHNRILLLWLLIVIGFVVAPAKSFASCDMETAKTAASRHACCVKKVVCACDVSAQDGMQRGSLPGTAHAGRARCACTINPAPVNSAPRSEPLRLSIVAALPVRAGPVCAVSEVTASASVLATLTPVGFHRFVPPCPPRAPPF